MIQTKNVQVSPELAESFMYVVPILVFVELFLGNFIYKKVLESAKSKTLIIQKMTIFMSATLIKCGLLEGATIFTTIVYLLTGEVMFIGTVGLLIVIFYTFKPSKEKAIMDLELSHEDIRTINNPEAVIAEVNTDNY